MSYTLTVSAYPDTLPEMTQNYTACVTFMADWISQQDGANGKDSVELFDEFKTNVCLVMKGKPGGSA